MSNEFKKMHSQLMNNLIDKGIKILLRKHFLKKQKKIFLAWNQKITVIGTQVTFINDGNGVT